MKYNISPFFCEKKGKPPHHMRLPCSTISLKKVYFKKPQHKNFDGEKKIWGKNKEVSQGPASLEFRKGVHNTTTSPVS